MLSDEEKEAVEEIKKDSEYYDILENIKQNKYNMRNVEKLMRDTTTCDFTEYEIAQSIVYFVNQVEKQSKEIEELKEKEKNLLIQLKDSEKELLEVCEKLRNSVSKDKIKEILGIEEDINNEKLLSLLQTIVDENARLEDIEDRKVQIEYNNVFNKGVKSVEDKIKAKIEEVKDGTYDAKIVLQSLLEKE